MTKLSRQLVEPNISPHWIYVQWAFLEMENDPETAEYTALTASRRHYDFNVLPFGVTNGPGVFQRLMSNVLHGLLGIYALNYIDDILISGKTHGRG